MFTQFTQRIPTFITKTYVKFMINKHIYIYKRYTSECAMFYVGHVVWLVYFCCTLSHQPSR